MTLPIGVPNNISWTGGAISNPANVLTNQNIGSWPPSSNLVVKLGTIAVNPSTKNAYIATSRSGGTTNWALFASGSGGDVLSVNGTANQISASPTTGAVVLSLIGPYTPATYTAHGVLVGEAATSIVATAVGTDGQVLTGNSAADPAFAAIGTKSGLTAHGVVISENASAFAATAAGATGQVLTGVTGADPVWTALPAFNIVDNTTGTVASPTTIAVNTTYIADQASVTTGFILPATALQGQRFTIIGNGPGGWQLQQNASQIIKQNSNSTTSGTGGSLSSTNRYNSVSMVATVGGASTVWVVADASGTFTFV